ncbi:MAG: hypothetical protein AMK75_03785 [Planctomycetes bacterium SM23_65]|nr:MAG: hypothetical protein AMK75_03785 [Planctomycetes bacterium SM23_65]
MLVPASYSQKTDALGFLWDIQSYGGFSNGTNSCFSGAVVLHVNGSQFSSSTRMMTPDGSTYLFGGSKSGVEIVRRVKIDTQLSAVRFVEMFTNRGGRPVTISVRLLTYLGANCGAVLTDNGRSGVLGLQRKESGLVAVAQPGSRPSAVFFLGDSRSKFKPSISIQSNQQFHFTYALTIGPGKTVSILHGLAQRYVRANPDAKLLASLFKPMKSRRFVRDIPRDVRRTIANLKGFGYGLGAEVQTGMPLEALGIERQNVDVLAIGEETRLHGSASCARLAVATAYGSKVIAFEKVAALVGGRHGGRNCWVYLRDGQVFTGQVTAEKLRFTTGSGLTVDLDMATLDRLVCAAKPEDGKPPATVSVFVETFEGDRLAALANEPAATLELLTPWCARRLSLDELRWVGPHEENLPGHLVHLKDGSRFSAFLGEDQLTVKTLDFGVQKFTPADLCSIVAVGAPTPKDQEKEEAEITAPHVVLVGGGVLVGRVDLARVHLLAGGQVVTLPPEQIRALHNVTQEEGSEDANILVQAEIWGGGTVSGHLR